MTNLGSGCLLHKLDWLIDERLGVIREIRELRRQPGSPDFYHFMVLSCNTGALNGHGITGAPGGLGAATERCRALTKAIGESVERYCSAFYDLHSLPFSSSDSAPFPCVSPKEFALYSENQYSCTNFPYVPFLGSTQVYWTAGQDLVTRKTCYIPASMVYLPWHSGNDRKERQLAAQISTGLACHSDLVSAAINGICEVIERDAFTITWQARMSRMYICLDTLSKNNRELVARFEQTRSKVVILNTTMDHGVPSVMAVLRNEHKDRPALVFASAAQLDPEEAIQKSLEELALVYHCALKTKAERRPIVPSRKWDDVNDQESHLNLYCHHGTIALADFAFKSRERIAVKEIPNLSSGNPVTDLQTLVEKVAAVGHRVLLADVTTEDIRSLGAVVVRAVIPGFHPMFIGHRNRALGGTRLWTVPQRLGYPGITPKSGDNPAPHPFS